MCHGCSWPVCACMRARVRASCVSWLLVVSVCACVRVCALSVCHGCSWSVCVCGCVCVLPVPHGCSWCVCVCVRARALNSLIRYDSRVYRFISFQMLMCNLTQFLFYPKTSPVPDPQNLSVCDYFVCIMSDFYCASYNKQESGLTSFSLCIRSFDFNA